MTDTHGAVFWTELMTRDVEAAKRYYEKICKWTFKSMPMGPGNPDYVLGMKGETPIVGAAVEETVASGGTLKREPFEIPGTGRIAIVTDPTGAIIGLMTPVEMQGS